VYATELANAKIRIAVPKGSYVPTFSRHEAPSRPRVDHRQPVRASGAATV
jgi:hypothetical protein